jgi:hypothetical protein
LSSCWNRPFQVIVRNVKLGKEVQIVQRGWDCTVKEIAGQIKNLQVREVTESLGNLPIKPVEAQIE